MKCQNLFSEKNKKNISVCRVLKILPRVLHLKELNTGDTNQFDIELVLTLAIR